MRSPSKRPCTSALSVETSPLKTPVRATITCWQSSNFASIVPSRISRLHELIVPDTDTPGPTIIVRTSASSFCGQACAPVSSYGRVCVPSVLGDDKSLGRTVSPDLPRGSTGFSNKPRLSGTLNITSPLSAAPVEAVKLPAARVNAELSAARSPKLSQQPA